MYLLIEKGTTFYLKSIPLIEVKPVALHVQKQHKTDDGGITWAAPTTSVFEGLLSVHFTDTKTGYIVGTNGTILKTTKEGGNPTGLTELSLKTNSLTIYPNPALNLVTIETSEPPTNGQLTILNLTGQNLITRQISEPKTVIDISNLPSGVYFVRLTNEKTVAVGKIIKQ